MASSALNGQEVNSPFAPWLLRCDTQRRHRPQGEHEMLTILLVILLLIALGALPTWPYSRNWGYGPGGGVSVLLIILIVLILSGHV